jgi:hypothetical protein
VNRMLTVAALAAGAIAIPVAVSTAATAVPVKAPPVDKSSGSATTQFFYFSAWSETVGSGLKAKGSFEFKYKTGLRVRGTVTCLRAEGRSATFGGVITDSAKVEQLEGAGAVGQYVEFSMLETRAKQDKVSGVSFVGSDPASCDNDYDREFTTPTHSVYVFDLYAPPFVPDPVVTTPDPTTPVDTTPAATTPAATTPAATTPAATTPASTTPTL